MTNENQHVTPEAELVIRDFLAEQFGTDTGKDLSDAASVLLERLSDAVLLRDKEAEEHFRQYALRLQKQIKQALLRVDGIPDRLRIGAEPEQIRDDIRAVFAEKQD